MGRLTLISLITVPIWGGFFLMVSSALGGRGEVSFEISFVDIVIASGIILVGVPLMHEAVHGIVARLAGARPSYGIGPGFAYTTFQEPVGKRVYLLIGLAPLIVLSILGVVMMVLFPQVTGLTLVFLITNATGAVGDMWMAWRTLLLPDQASIYDLADGFAAYLPER